MGSPSCLSFQIKRQQPKFLTPAKPTPQEKKLLSEVDIQEGLRFQTPFILSYKNENSSLNQKDPVEVIRDALSSALVYYYPYAGRVREGPNGKLFVDCNGEGILFIEADANVTLEQLGDSLQPPCPFLEDFLYDVPGTDDILGTPLLLVQVTRLTCGGFIFALRMNHTMSDAVGMGQLLNAVGEMARGASEPTVKPVWERHLLDARDPPQVKFPHHEYGEENGPHQGSVIRSMNQPDLVQRCVYFGPKEVMTARSHLSQSLCGSTCTTFELITACVWKCRTLSLELDPKEVVRLSLVVNARRKKNNLSIPLGFYGNAIGFPCVVTTAELLCNKPLGYAVELVKEAKGKMNEEYIRSCADLLAKRGWPALTLAGNNFILSDNTRTNVGDTNFGWGKPIVAGPAKSVNLISFYVRDCYQDAEEQYGILVPICLPFSCVGRFEQEIRNLIS